MLFGEGSEARSCVVEAVAHDEVLGEDGGCFVHRLHRPLAQPARHAVHIDPLLNQLTPVAAYKELEAPRKLEVAEIGGLDFKMVASKLLLVALGNRIFGDVELNLDPGYGDVRVAEDALGRHSEKPVRFLLSLLFLCIQSNPAVDPEW